MRPDDRTDHAAYPGPDRRAGPCAYPRNDRASDRSGAGTYCSTGERTADGVLRCGIGGAAA